MVNNQNLLWRYFLWVENLSTHQKIKFKQLKIIFQVEKVLKKYDSNGDAGLIDKRGHHKKDDEVDELERLRRDNNLLKRQLEEKDMVVELLKKVQEIERRRY